LVRDPALLERRLGSGLPPHPRNIDMFYFYILRSLKDRSLYYGYTSDLRKRFKDHNSGRVTSTKNRRPLEIVYLQGL
jgi:predicted GIY-YIG superfamily endonuclease